MLTVSTSDDNSLVTGTVTGTGGFRLIGGGTLTLPGQLSMTGTTSIDDGALVLNGANNVASIVVNSGGTLAGSGKVTGSVTARSGGEVAPGMVPPDTAVQFDGANQYIAVPHDAELNEILTGDYTVQFWLYKDSEASDWQRLVGKGDDATRTLGIFEEAGTGRRIQYQVNTTGGYLSLLSTAVVPIGQWTHVAVTKHGNMGSIYINGRLDTQGTFPGTPLTDSSPLTFGRAPTFLASLPGRLADVAIYDVALSANQLNNVFDPATLDALASYWPLDEATGTSVADVTGGRTGTLTNMTADNLGAPGPVSRVGILTMDSNYTLEPGSTLNIEIVGTGSSAGTDYDQVRITGSNRTVTLTGATLVVGATVEPSFGTTYRIIDNTSSTNIVGTFAELPPGAYLGTQFGTFQISYVGGTGNDVTLTLVLTTEVRLDGSGNLVITDVATGGQNDNLTIQSDTANSRFIITDMTHTLGIVGTIAGAILSNNAHTVTVPFSSVSGNILIDTRTGNDSLTIDLSLGNFSKTVTYDGGSQTTGDSLALVGGGPFATVTHGLTGAASGTIDVTGNSRFSYGNVEPLADRLTAANRAFNFQGGAESITVTDGTAADGQMTIDSTLSVPVTFASPPSLLTIAAGNGDDTVTVSSLDSGFAGTLIVQGDDGADTVIIGGALNLSSQTLTVTAETVNFNAATAAQNLTVTGTAVSQTAPLTVSGTATFNAATVTLADANNDFRTVQATGSSATLVDKNAIDLGTVSLTGSFSLTAGGSIANGAGASISVGNNANFTGPSIDLGNQSGDTVNFGSLTFNTTGGAGIAEDSATDLSGTSMASSLTLVSAGAVTDTVGGGASLTVTNNAALSGTSFSLADNAADVLSVGGNVAFSAGSGGAITVAAAGTVNFGSLTVSATGVVAVREDSATDLRGTNTAGSLTLVSAGAVTDTVGGGASLTVTNNAVLSGTSVSLGDNAADVLSVGGNAAFSASSGGSITLAAAGSLNFGSLTVNTSGAVAVTEDSATDLSGASTAGSLTLVSTGAVTDAVGGGASLAVTGNAAMSGTSFSLGDQATDGLRVDGNAAFTASGGAITVAAAGTVNFGSLTFNTTGAVGIAEDSATDMSGTNTASSLALVSAGAITDTVGGGASLNVTNHASLSGASISLADNTGDVLSVGGNAAFNASGGGAITLAAPDRSTSAR